jgi:hypothetical protein
VGDLRDVEAELRAKLLAFPPPVRGELLSVLRMPPWHRAGIIGSLYRAGRARQLSELLMDLEEDRYARTVVLGLLAELERT